MKNIIETHAHLDDKKFEKNFYEIIKKIKKRNIILVNNIFSDTESLNKIYKFDDPLFKYTIGIHPVNVAKEWNNDYKNNLLNLLKKYKEKIIAIGETGIDKFWPYDEKQIDAFLWQAKLAKENNLSLVIHIRDAYDEFLELIKNNKNLLTKKWVVHCFSGNQEQANFLKSNNIYLGVGGTLTFKSNNDLRKIIKNYKKELIVLETDSPYLSPEPKRGEVNNSTNLKYVIKKLSEIWNINEQEVIDITSNNSKRLFELNDKK